MTLMYNTPSSSRLTLSCVIADCDGILIAVSLSECVYDIFSIIGIYILSLNVCIWVQQFGICTINPRPGFMILWNLPIRSTIYADCCGTNLIGTVDILRVWRRGNDRIGRRVSEWIGRSVYECIVVYVLGERWEFWSWRYKRFSSSNREEQKGRVSSSPSNAKQMRTYTNRARSAIK